jgi:outer membrane lipoprotein SlyB
MKKTILISCIMVLSLAGCAGNSLTVAKCGSYVNGECINAQPVQMYECKEPLNQDGKIYCK